MCKNKKTAIIYRSSYTQSTYFKNKMSLFYHSHIILVYQSEASHLVSVNVVNIEDGAVFERTSPNLHDLISCVHPSFHVIHKTAINRH